MLTIPVGPSGTINLGRERGPQPKSHLRKGVLVCWCADVRSLGVSPDACTYPKGSNVVTVPIEALPWETS